jgi:hypothetical protein
LAGKKKDPSEWTHSNFAEEVLNGEQDKWNDAEKKILEIAGALLIVLILLLLAYGLRAYLNRKYRRDFNADYAKAEELFEQCLTNEEYKEAFLKQPEWRENAARKRYIKRASHNR